MFEWVCVCIFVCMCVLTHIVVYGLPCSFSMPENVAYYCQAPSIWAMSDVISFALVVNLRLTLRKLFFPSYVQLYNENSEINPNSCRIQNPTYTYSTQKNFTQTSFIDDFKEKEKEKELLCVYTTAVDQ